MNGIKHFQFLRYFIAGCFCLSTICTFSQDEETPEAQDQPNVTAKELTDAVKVFVDRVIKDGGGFLLMEDEIERKELKLKLKKINKDETRSINYEMHFVCVEFKDEAGVIYDLDIFMEGSRAEELHISRIKIHKVAGKARYIWKKENGFWRVTYVDKESEKYEGGGDKNHQLQNPDEPKE